jgi:hypothetical protein
MYTNDRGSQYYVADFEIYENGTDVQGKYAHIVGNGADEDNRSNAHTLDWEGNAWFAGDVYIGSTSGTDKDEGSVKLATIEEVNSLIEASNEIPSVVKEINKGLEQKFWRGTQEEYDAIEVKDSSVMYIVMGSSQEEEAPIAPQVQADWN